MAVVTSDFLAGLLTQYRALFEREFRAAMQGQWWPNVSMRFETPGQATGSYNWLGTVPKLEDVSHKTVAISGLGSFNFSLANAEFQAAIEVERMAIERDQLGLISPRVSQLGLEAARYPAEQLCNLVLNNANGFDGAAFFANTRVIGESANIDNIQTGTGVTVAQIQADIGTMNGVMQLYQDDKGRPEGRKINTFMVPTALEVAFWQALNRTAGDNVVSPIPPQSINAGITMWAASGYNVIVNPYLTDVNDWYGFFVGGPAERPFLYQVELPYVIESDTNPNSRENIINRKFLYSCYGRWNVALTDPRFGIKVTNT